MAALGSRAGCWGSDVLTILARMADPWALPVLWHPPNDSQVVWGHLLPVGDAPVLVGVEHFSGPVWCLHVPDEDVARQLVKAAVWAGGVDDAYETCQAEAWVWPQLEIKNDRDEVILYVDAEPGIIAGGRSLRRWSRGDA